ncbi:MAG TPA: hypothetical protein DD435_17515 [Cyanobacteria bacterium UBA8530]|nr:hypothetical protein [Cyanobacteria bacterium UBA8530]
MKNFFVLLAMCLGSLFPFGGQAVVPPSPSPSFRTGFLEGEILVKFKEEVPEKKIEEILSNQKVQVLGFIEGLGIYRLGLPEGTSVEAMLERFRAIPEVQYAEPNHRLHIMKKEGGPQ